VTRLAEVSITPTEPLRDGTAEATLELDKVSPMRLADGITCPDTLRSALTAHRIFRLELLLLLLSIDTIFHATEVGLLALEALVIGQLIHRVLFQVVMVFAGLFQARIFVDAFFLCSLNSLVFDDVFYFGGIGY